MSLSVAIASSHTPTTSAGVNDTRLADFKAFVREKAKEAALGGDALPAFAIGFVRAVYDGVIDVAKDANGEDAATRWFKEYSAIQGKKAFHDRSKASQKVQISKFKQLQDAASNPKYDFVDVLNRAITIRQTAIDDDIEVKSPFPAYVDCAREQKKLDDEMDDAMIFATVTKTESTREVTVEGQLKKAQKIIDDLIAGEKNPGVMDNSPEVMQVGELLNTRIADIIKLQSEREALEKALAAGYVQNEDGSLSLPK
jgi:hypothetical protein